MKVEVAAAHELSGELEARWRSLQAANPALGSPYFCVEYTQSVARVRDDVEVAVLFEGPRIAGLLPFQRYARRRGRPVGGPVSDYQALIASPDTVFDPAGLLRGSRLDTFEFDHLLACQTQFAPYHRARDESPILELRDGFEALAASMKARGSRAIPTARRKARKLAREVGPIRYESHVRDPAVLRTLLDWKSRQCRETGTEDLFRHEWARALVEHIAELRGHAFAGMLSALWAGDELVAAHMGMRSAGVWHYWFPSYDSRFEKYSPGMTLLVHMAESAEGLGLHTIDFGKGENAYKERFKTAAVALAEGRVSLPSVTAFATAVGERTVRMLRRMPVSGPVRRVPGALLRRLRRRSAYR